MKKLEENGILPKPPAKPEGTPQAAQGSGSTRSTTDTSTATVPKASVI